MRAQKGQCLEKDSRRSAFVVEAHGTQYLEAPAASIVQPIEQGAVSRFLFCFVLVVAVFGVVVSTAPRPSKGTAAYIHILYCYRLLEQNTVSESVVCIIHSHCIYIRFLSCPRPLERNPASGGARWMQAAKLTPF